jgi:hypothetical protein
MQKKAASKVQIGHRYGGWTIEGPAERVGSDLRYPCACDCGTRRFVSAITLRNGSSLSCGCRRGDKVGVTKETSEGVPLPREVQTVFDLIIEGCLPPAEQFSIGAGAPTWSLPTIAKIIGVGEKDLIQHLRSAGPRFGLRAGEGAPEIFGTGSA